MPLLGTVGTASSASFGGGAMSNTPSGANFTPATQELYVSPQFMTRSPTTTYIHMGDVFSGSPGGPFPANFKIVYIELRGDLNSSSEYVTFSLYNSTGVQSTQDLHNGQQNNIYYQAFVVGGSTPAIVNTNLGSYPFNASGGSYNDELRLDTSCSTAVGSFPFGNGAFYQYRILFEVI